MLVSAIHQCEPAVITQTSPPFWTSFRPSALGHHTAPGWAPWAISDFSAAIYVTHDSLHHEYVSMLLSVQPTLLPPLCPRVREGSIFRHCKSQKTEWKHDFAQSRPMAEFPEWGKWWKKHRSPNMLKSAFLVPCFNHELLRATNVLPLSHLPVIKNRILAPTGKEISLGLWPTQAKWEEDHLPYEDASWIHCTTWSSPTVDTFCVYESLEGSATEWFSYWSAYGLWKLEK